MLTLKICRLNEKARLPEYAHPGDAGLDLFSVADTFINPGESKLIPTGIAIELPPDTEAQIRPRSGLALKHQITLLNSPGTIDEGYRGEICVIVINHGKEVFHVVEGMKIAQMVIQKVLKVQIQEADSLGETERGANGFGSSGIMPKQSE